MTFLDAVTGFNQVVNTSRARRMLALDSVAELINGMGTLLHHKKTGAELWRLASSVTGATWPPAYQPKSPCPTLKVIGAITDFVSSKQITE